VVSEVSKAGDIYHWPFFLRAVTANELQRLQRHI